MMDICCTCLSENNDTNSLISVYNIVQCEDEQLNSIRKMISSCTGLEVNIMDCL